MAEPIAVLSDPEEVHNALVVLGLEEMAFANATLRADNDVKLCTDNDPSILKGILRWGRTTRYLREELAPKGWIADEVRNSPFTLSPDGTMAIVVATGDAQTGMTDGPSPTTQYPKGPTMQQAVENNCQLALFDVEETDDSEIDVDIPAGLTASATTWLLLIRRKRNTVFMELSCPNSFDEAGWVTSWSKRIVLPVVSLKRDVVDLQDEIDETDELDIAVERRT